jgi:phosphoglycolate phosphatase-like HAD superfamily hydrolase
MNRPLQGPLRRSNVIVRDLGDEVLIYGAEQQVIHVLNATARVIWELCDGQHDEHAIIRELRQRFELHANDNVEADVAATLAELHAKGLLEQGHA